MKIYSQEDFENFEIIDGIRFCPNGDYTRISRFDERCSFGEWCSFGKWCSFGEGCSFGEWCSFGERCRFGEWCKYIDFEFSKLIILDGVLPWTCRVYKNEEEYFLSVGCKNFTSIKEAKKDAQYKPEWEVFAELLEVLITGQE